MANFQRPCTRLALAPLELNKETSQLAGKGYKDSEYTLLALEQRLNTSCGYN